VVDGSVLHRSALRFAEDTQAVYTTAREGAPYLVSKVVVPLPGLVPYETWVRRTESLAIDKAVSDYLTKYLPLPANEAVTVIPKPHWLYSPFLCRILYDLLQGFIVVDSLYRPDSQILKELSRYEPLLEFDPCLKAIDNRFVVIHPHDITLERALELYAEKLKAEAEKNIADFGDGIKVLNGRFGPYITDGTKNAKIPKDTDPKSVTHAQAKELLKAAPAKSSRRAPRKTATKKAATKRKK
jgi:hypothetical protein